MTVQPAPSSPPPPSVGIDFTLLPLAEVAATLRDLAWAQLDCLLGERPRPGLEEKLPSAVARLLAAAHAPVTEDASLERTFRRALAGELTKEAWKAEVVTHLGRRLGGMPPDHLPDDLWFLVAELSWSQPEFQYEVAMKIRNHLRTRVLLLGGNVPKPLLAPRCFWLLLALVKPIPLLGRPRPEAGVRRTALDRLRREGQRQTHAEGWAGFWEQWIACRALCVPDWPDAVKQLSPDLRSALAALPLWEHYLKAQEPETAGGKAPVPAPLRLAAPGWEQGMPAWFQTEFCLSVHKGGKP